MRIEDIFKDPDEFLLFDLKTIAGLANTNIPICVALGNIRGETLYFSLIRPQNSPDYNQIWKNGLKHAELDSAPTFATVFTEMQEMVKNKTLFFWNINGARIFANYSTKNHIVSQSCFRSAQDVFRKEMGLSDKNKSLDLHKCLTEFDLKKDPSPLSDGVIKNMSKLFAALRGRSVQLELF